MNDSYSLNKIIRKTQEKLCTQGISEANLDAKILVEWITGTNAFDRISQPDMCLSPEQITQLEQAIQRRLAGEPVYRIIGIREFYGIPLALSQDTLEPRPDTETLVDLVLPFLKKNVEKSRKVTLLDMGTGSGAIVIAILKQIPQSYAVAVDISEDALKTATKNAKNAEVIQRFTPCSAIGLILLQIGLISLFLTHPIFQKKISKILQKKYVCMIHCAL